MKRKREPNESGEKGIGAVNIFSKRKGGILEGLECKRGEKLKAVFSLFGLLGFTLEGLNSKQSKVNSLSYFWEFTIVFNGTSIGQFFFVGGRLQK